VYFPVDGAATGEWWPGHVVEDRRNGDDAEVALDPWDAGGLWERFAVAWEDAQVSRRAWSARPRLCA
jgi:hypothetical protein